jgi:type 1 fimbriae regulatory protein FimB
MNNWVKRTNCISIILNLPNSLPPRKTPFLDRREREFLYLEEVDALIATTKNTRSPIRNSAIALLLFCQSLQPIELYWLRWTDVNFTQKTITVVRNRKSVRHQFLPVINLQALCLPEVELLEQLKEQRTTEWIFASERQQRLSDRSLHHIVQQAGKAASLDFPVHPYMLRKSGLYYRATLLLQPLNLSLHQCCLIWNWHTQNISRFSYSAVEYRAIDPEQIEGFLVVLSQIKAFSGIQLFENVIDYVLGAYLLFPQLKHIPQDYWLAPLDSQINFAENTTKNKI